MTLLKFIYIAGPFRGATPWDVAENVRAAERYGLAVAKGGAYPVIPHANTQHFDKQMTDRFWLEGTMELMIKCDAVVFMANWQTSEGAKAEKLMCEANDIPHCICEDETDASRFAKTIAGGK